jgi:hypothetical protein
VKLLGRADLESRICDKETGNYLKIQCVYNFMCLKWSFKNVGQKPIHVFYLKCGKREFS